MNERLDVVTVTLNPAIDNTVAVPNFRAGEVNRAARSQLDAGGKGVNVASALADDGFRVGVTGFLGRDNDAIFRALFERKQIVDRFVRIDGATRTGIKIVDHVNDATTDINFAGQTGGPDELDALRAALMELVAGCEWVVLAGSVPAGLPASIYHDLTASLAGKHVALDASGEALRLALPARPYMVKPNVAELREILDLPLHDEAEIVAAARELQQAYGIACVAVSMGADGAIVVEGDSVTVAVPARVEVASTVGAGDAMVAGLVSGAIRGLPLAARARRATAFSMGAIGQLGSGLPSRETLSELEARVTTRPPIHTSRTRVME